MTRFAGIRFFVTLFALLFLVGQGVAYTHTIEYGENHTHDGVACSVSVLGEDDVVIPTPPATQMLPADHPPVIDFPIVQTVSFQSANPLRGPPPRAPPA